MSCSRSTAIHLLRGLGAVILVVLALSLGKEHPVLLPLLLIGAVALLGGCTACWLTGLVEVGKAKRDRPQP